MDNVSLSFRIRLLLSLIVVVAGAFHAGLPAKSGVSGVFSVVIPGCGALTIYSPPLADGNSIRALKFCEALLRKWRLHCFDRVIGSSWMSLSAPSTSEINTNQAPSSRLVPQQQWPLPELVVCHRIMRAASKDDVRAMDTLLSVAQAPWYNVRDTLGRSAVHIAALHGASLVIESLLERQPSDHPQVISLLTNSSKTVVRPIDTSISMLKLWTRACSDCTDRDSDDFNVAMMMWRRHRSATAALLKYTPVTQQFIEQFEAMTIG